MVDDFRGVVHRVRRRVHHLMIDVNQVVMYCTSMYLCKSRGIGVDYICVLYIQNMIIHASYADC